MALRTFLHSRAARLGFLLLFLQRGLALWRHFCGLDATIGQAMHPDDLADMRDDARALAFAAGIVFLQKIPAVGIGDLAELVHDELELSMGTEPGRYHTREGDDPFLVSALLGIDEYLKGAG